MNSTASSQAKQERIDLRTTKEVKDLLNRAAALSMMPVSSFLLSAACDRAKALIAEQETIILSDKERNHFLELLESPPEPNDKLKTAMQRYHERL